MKISDTSISIPPVKWNSSLLVESVNWSINSTKPITYPAVFVGILFSKTLKLLHELGTCLNFHTRPILILYELSCSCFIVLRPKSPEAIPQKSFISWCGCTILPLICSVLQRGLFMTSVHFSINPFLMELSCSVSFCSSISVYISTTVQNVTAVVITSEMYKWNHAQLPAVFLHRLDWRTNLEYITRILNNSKKPQEILFNSIVKFTLSYYFSVLLLLVLVLILLFVLLYYMNTDKSCIIHIF